MSQHHTEENFKQHTFYVAGMHCASCEVLIEKKLLKQPGVVFANASLKDAQVIVKTNPDTRLNLADLNRDIEPLGYQLKTSPVAKEVTSLFYKNNSGSLTLNKKRFHQLLKSVLLALSFLAVFFVIERFQFGRFVSVDATSTYSAFFLLGLVAGVSSCAALIGGLLLSLIKHWNEVYIDAEKTSQKATPHLLFHTGRMASFFVLGGVLGIIGDAITWNNTTTYALLTIAVSLLMIILAFQMLGASWATKLAPRLPKFITRVATNEQSFQGKFMPFVTGALTFFLPCGFTLIAQGVALATGSFMSGALIMTFFAFGTLPMLTAISLTGLTFTSRPHLTAKFSYVAGVIIIFFALYNINGQFNVLGLPSLSDITVLSSKNATNDMAGTPYAGSEEQIISLVAKGFSYTPTSPTSLKAGIPTKLVVDNQGIQGCGTYMASRGLINGFVALEKGENIIDVGSPKPGTYKITCSMGMVPPVTITIK
ncbi:MAG: sulfite exporter TauE/SafE family protein [Candidatus Buchananbacteria bacterium]|nr:sulfite exporter TauE/SafE family protein [Candidatus Buchananbacteria bacterium]